MPVIRYTPLEVNDSLLAGEQMRNQALSLMVMSPIAMFVLEEGYNDTTNLIMNRMVSGDKNLSPMVGSYPVQNRDILRSPFAETMRANNSCICTPTGAIVRHDIGQHIMDIPPESTVRWVLAGTTKDNAGSALGNCRVIVFDTGDLFVGGAPIVAEQVSDGSGNYYIEVPKNSPYTVMAYKDGSPDVGGVTINDLIPVAM